MPTNTDYSGSARAARLRRITAAQGPAGILPVRANIGSMALDAKLGQAYCCANPDPYVQWTTSPITLRESRNGSNWVYSAVYARVTSTTTFYPLFGELVPSPQDTTEIKVQVNGPVWTIQFVFSSQQQDLSFSQIAGFTFNYATPITLQNTFTYVIR